MAKENAQTAYTQAKTDIASLLGWFECELYKTPAKIDWTHVGEVVPMRWTETPLS